MGVCHNVRGPRRLVRWINEVNLEFTLRRKRKKIMNNVRTKRMERGGGGENGRLKKCQPHSGDRDKVMGRRHVSKGRW